MNAAVVLKGLGHAHEWVWHWAWDNSLYGSLLILFVFAVQRFARGRLPVRGAYILSCLVLVRLLIPVVPELRVGWRPEFRPENDALAALQGETLHTVSAIALVSEPAPPAGMYMRFTGKPVRRPVDWPTVFKWIWTAGVVTVLGTVTWRHRRVAAWVRKQRPIRAPELADPGSNCPRFNSDSQPKTTNQKKAHYDLGVHNQTRRSRINPQHRARPH